MIDEEMKRSYERYKQWQVNKSHYRSECIAYVLMLGIGAFFVIKNWQGVFIGVGIALIVGAVCLLIRILHKWSNKQQALSELKVMAKEMGATDIQVDSEKGTISFVTTSESFDDRKFDEMSRALSDKGLKIRVSRTKEEKENMPEAKSTDIGYVNKNNQRNNGITPHEGTDNNQYFYEMECLNCGHKYYANGTDIWQRKCPACQGGRS
ncbi:MAG: hypothetical protein SPL82_04535 [Lachnospiraceae bacterium]|nr:hypothetical protein [Lachnospiraceae bacterium]